MPHRRVRTSAARPHWSSRLRSRSDGPMRARLTSLVGFEQSVFSGQCRSRRSDRVFLFILFSEVIIHLIGDCKEIPSQLRAVAPASVGKERGKCR